MSNRPIGTPNEVVNVGDELTLLVIRVDPNERRIGLSLKELAHAIAPPPEMEGEGGAGRAKPGEGGENRGDDYEDEERKGGGRRGSGAAPLRHIVVAVGLVRVRGAEARGPG